MKRTATLNGHRNRLPNVATPPLRYQVRLMQHFDNETETIVLLDTDERLNAETLFFEFEPAKARYRSQWVSTMAESSKDEISLGDMLTLELVAVVGEHVIRLA